MTATVWDDPTVTPTPEPPRDRWGRYLITPPGSDDGKPVPHTRATTVAKALQDEGGLTRWKQRMTALGIVARPDLFARLSATNPDDKKTLDRLTEEAMEASSASAGRNLGTAVHAFIEQVNLGATPNVPPPWDRDVTAYTQAIERAGLTVDVELVEQIVVLSSLSERIAGTFDLAVNHPAWDLPRIGDLKTGSSVKYGAGEWAIQLAIYSHAETCWDPTTDTHTPMPPVDADRGIVIHLPAGKGECTIYELDLARGWERIQTALDVRAWRKAKDLLTPIEQAAAPAPTTTTVMPGPAPAPTVDQDLLGPPPPPPARDAGSHERAVIDKRVSHLADRLAALKAHSADALDQVAQRWPGDTPTLRQHLNGDTTLEPHQLDAIDTLITNVEAAVEAPWDDTRDPNGPLAPTDPRIAAIKARIEALPTDLAGDVLAQAAADEIPKLSGGKATVAHLDQVDGLVTAADAVLAERFDRCADHIAALPDDVNVTELLAHLGCAFDVNVTPWPVTDAQVDAIADLVDGIDAGALTVTDGHLTAADGALDQLIERFGGKRPLLAAAKAQADAIGVDRPRAATDVADSVQLLARLTVTDTSVAA